MASLKRVAHFYAGASPTHDDPQIEEQRVPEPIDFLAILRRRKLALLLPIVVLTLASFIVASRLPEMYRSTATILIEQQEIPPDLVASTVTSYADERIQTITQRVMTTSNLQKIIEKFDLFPNLRKTAPIESIADHVRSQFNVERVRAGRGVVAFNVSYESRSPTEAQAVAAELTSLYLEENLKTRMESASDTTLFLATEAERLGADISELEAKIASFKQQYMGRLPEQLDLNLQLMARTEQQMQQIEQRIRTLEDRKIYLQGSMAQLKSAAQGAPNQIATQLQTLRAQLSGMLAVYTSDHPDVKRLRSEIAALEARKLDEVDEKSLEKELNDLTNRLAQVLENRAPQHPDVTALEQQIAEIESALATAKLKDYTTSSSSSADAGYVDLESQYQAANREIAALRSDYSELESKLAAYEDRVTQIPQIEREYSVLVRDRDNLMTKYREIRAKMSSARVAESLEKARKGERFSLIEPARLPLTPFSPNRRKIITMGVVGSVGIGLGTAIISEFRHKAVYGPRAVIALLGVPPLAVIPYIRNAKDRRRRFLKWLAIGLVIVFVVGIFATFVHTRIMPLESLWIMLIAKFTDFWAAAMDQLNAIRAGL
jgi:uncharacterized protein involved in exopolysaccharide biosynthesis